MNQQQQATLKAAVIGCGVAATWRHVPSLLNVPQVELVAVCDVDRVRANDVARRFGISSFYDDASEMLREASPDIVHVLTNPESHLELSILAMEAGCSVLIEKPFVYSVAEADKIIAKAEETGTRFTVIQDDAFTPAVAALKRRIATGEIGKVVSVQFLAGSPYQSSKAQGWYFETYGGRMGETLPHALCLLADLLAGLEVVHVDGRQLGHWRRPDDGQQKPHGVDELHVLLNSSSDNAVGIISQSLNREMGVSLLVCGTEGNLVAFLPDEVAAFPPLKLGLGDAVDVGRNVSDQVLRKLRLRRGPPAGRTLVNSGHYRQIKDFVEGVRDGREFPVNHARARECVALWEQIVGSFS